MGPTPSIQRGATICRQGRGASGGAVGRYGRPRSSTLHLSSSIHRPPFPDLDPRSSITRPPTLDPHRPRSSSLHARSPGFEPHPPSSIRHPRPSIPPPRPSIDLTPRAPSSAMDFPSWIRHPRFWIVYHSILDHPSWILHPPIAGGGKKKTTPPPPGLGQTGRRKQPPERGFRAGLQGILRDLSPRDPEICLQG